MTHTITAAAYDGDIASRLRNWRGLHLAHSGRLFEEAADAIERLRQSDRSQPIKPAGRTPTTHATPDEGSVQDRCTLTVEERASIEVAAIVFDGADNDISAVLRHLLERLPCHT